MQGWKNGVRPPVIIGAGFAGLSAGTMLAENGVAVTVLPRLFVQATGMIQQRLDRKNHLNRVTVDLVKLF